MAHLKQPYFVDASLTHYYPGCTAENDTEIKAVERFDQITASGKRGSVLVGSRAIKEITLQWIDSTAKTVLEAFWDAVKDGSEFDYVVDDSVRRFGTGPPASWKFDTGGYIFGDDSDGNAITTTRYTLDNTELVFAPGQVDGFYETTLTMRKAV